MTSEQLEKIKKDLTVLTDEAEGTQSISLDLINICDPDNDGTVKKLNKSPEEIMDDIANKIDNDDVIVYTVIEFGDDYVLGDKLKYRLEIKPGPIKIGDIIATIEQNGVTKKIRSKFEGIVLGQDKKYEHLYPEADRHIIIKEVKQCKLDEKLSLEDLADKFPDTGDFNYNPENPDDPLVKIQEKFKLNSELYTLIKDNLCESVLPRILCNRYKGNSSTYNDSLPNGLERFENYYYHKGSVTPLFDKHPEPNDKGYYKKSDIAFCKSNTPLGNILQQYTDIDVNTNIFWSDIFQALCSEENIEKCKDEQSKSGVDIAKLNKIGDDIQTIRECYINAIIDQYNESVSYVKRDSDYSDCKFLASPNDSILISQTNSTYYYINLLTRLNMPSDSTYGTKYRELLNEIIRIRQSCEYYSKTQLIADFNSLFTERVRKKLGGDNTYSYSMIMEKYGKEEKTITFDDAKTLMSEYFGSDVPFIDDLVNMLVFISQMESKKSYYMTYDETYYDETTDNKGNKKYTLKTNYAYELVKDENRKLSEFWAEVIALYKDCAIEKCKKELLDYIAGQTGTNADGNSETTYVFADYPPVQQITVNNQLYDLYVFENRIEIDDSGNDDNNGNNINDADEPQRGEITVFDCEYWYLYFALATVISLPLVMDWADGLDIPTPVGLLSIPLPGIYICIACLPIKFLNIVVVFGLAIRGMWIFPIILVVNLSSTAINFLIPIKIAVEKLKEIFSLRLSSMEQSISDIADVLIYQLEEQNKQYRIQNKQYEVYKAALKSQQLENKALIKKGFKEAYMADADHRQVITRLEKLKDVPFKEEFEE